MRFSHKCKSACYYTRHVAMKHKIHARFQKQAAEGAHLAEVAQEKAERGKCIEYYNIEKIYAAEQRLRPYSLRARATMKSVQRQIKQHYLRPDLVRLTRRLKRIERACLCYRYIGQIVNYLKHKKDSCRDGAVYVDVEYYRNALTNNGKTVLVYGRRYATSKERIKTNDLKQENTIHRTLTLQGAPKELREYLCSGTETYSGYHDIDIVNCFLVIACWLAEKYNQDVPSLKSYCANDVSRKEYLDKIIEAHELVDHFGPHDARDVAKNLPITLLHGGTYDGWLLRNSL